MKKQIFVILALMMGLVAPVTAQNNKKDDARIKLAREKYAEAMAKIASVKQYEEDNIPNVNYTTVVRQQNWAGSGMRNDKIEFYYNEIEDEEEEYNPFPVGYSLLIARRTYNISDREFFEEYICDEKENPLFWFTRYDGFDENFDVIKVELRQYYDENGEAIRVICKISDEKGQMKECGMDDFVNVLAHAIDNFRQIKKAFHGIYDINY